MTGLKDALRRPGAKRPYVRRLFDTIAPRYDLITRLLSFGLDQRWKRAVVTQASVRARERVLDLACGTGDLAFLAALEGGRVTGLDITPKMIDLARVRDADRSSEPAGAAAAPSRSSPEGRSKVSWMVGDMGALPVGSSTIDLITTGYGLRNVPDLSIAIAEIARVLTPTGRLVSLDFNRPETAIVRGVYLAYLTVVGSALGLILHGDPDTYRYIPESIKRYPGAAGVADLLRAAGFRDVRVTPILGGLMTIHCAKKQAGQEDPVI